ncbi:MAG: DUF2752 domain-containing protein [Verrucomicrobiota bacterium]|nr:DUF2752 domain-containing protein [Verrucomicrobiota bacterium]
MRVSLRHLAPGELDHELIWLSVSVASAAAISSWLALHLPWPACVFRALTGLPCVTCGATRASYALLHGHASIAWRLNPLATLALGAVAVFDLYAAAVLLARLPRVRIGFRSLADRRAVCALLFAAALLNWAYLLRSGLLGR